MKLEVTNNELMTFHNEIMDMSKSIVPILTRTALNYFDKHNKGRINDLMKLLSEMSAKYFVIENNQVVMEAQPKEPMENESGLRKIIEPKPPLPKMKEGMILDDYEKEFNELMEQKVTLNVL